VIQYVKGALATLPYLGFLAPEEPEPEERLVRTNRLRSTWLDLIVTYSYRLDTSTSLSPKDGPLSVRLS